MDALIGSFLDLGLLIAPGSGRRSKEAPQSANARQSSHKED